MKTNVSTSLAMPAPLLVSKHSAATNHLGKPSLLIKRSAQFLESVKDFFKKFNSRPFLGQFLSIVIDIKHFYLFFLTASVIVRMQDGDGRGRAAD